MSALNKILVLEDDLDDFDILREHFRRNNDGGDQKALYYLERISNYDEAMQRLHVDQWTFFIVDYRLSDIDRRTGLDFIRDAFAQGYRAPALLISGMDELSFDRGTIDLIRSRRLRFLSKHEMNWGTISRSLDDLLVESHRVLLVEDDPDDVVLTMSHLQAIEHIHLEVDVAQSLEEAQALVGQHTYSAILLDYKLGAERGTDLLPGLKARNSKAVVTLCTEYSDIRIDSYAVHLLVDQRLRFITKDQINRNSLSRILLNTDVSGRLKLATDLNLPNRHLCSECDYYRAAQRSAQHALQTRPLPRLSGDIDPDH